MKELIKVQNHEGKNIVSARDLHAFLGIRTDFTDWCKRMFEYGFVENKDYSIILLKNEEKVSKSNPIDYLLTLDTAKEIAMIQKSAKGREVRNYFIDCENALHQVVGAIANAQAKTLANQKDSFELLQELEKIKQEYAQVFKRMAAIKKRLRANQKATFDTYRQLGMFEQAPQTTIASANRSFSTI